MSSRGSLIRVSKLTEVSEVHDLLAFALLLARSSDPHPLTKETSNNNFRIHVSASLHELTAVSHDDPFQFIIHAIATDVHNVTDLNNGIGWDVEDGNGLGIRVGSDVMYIPGCD